VNRNRHEEKRQTGEPPVLRWKHPTRSTGGTPVQLEGGREHGRNFPAPLVGPANSKAATSRSTPYAAAISGLAAGSIRRGGRRKKYAVLRNEPELYDISNRGYLAEQQGVREEDGGWEIRVRFSKTWATGVVALQFGGTQ
jgi:hypothetical protein